MATTVGKSPRRGVGGWGWKDRKQGLDRLPIREEEEEEEPRVWR